MKFNDFLTTPVEVDRRCFIYNNLESISFDEIEEEIRKRTKNLYIIVYGEYDPKCPLDPFVFLQASFEGYKYRCLLEKKAFKNKNVNDYYDYLADNLSQQFAYKVFRNSLGE